MNEEIVPPRRRVKSSGVAAPASRARQGRPFLAECAGGERRIALLAGSYMRQFENVSQELMSPLFKPAVSHFWRCAEEPWVKLSGTA